MSENNLFSNQSDIPTTPINVNIIEQFLQNQSKELDIKTKEIEQQKISDLHAFEYSKIALEKESVDRNSHREFIRKCRKDNFYFITGLVVLIIALVAYSLFVGKDQIAMEIIKSVIFLLSGGAGGYAIGRKTKENEKNNDS